MNKQRFLDELRKGLAGLPQQDVEERLAFYSEMIDDRMEEGLSEEEAIAEIGPVDGVVKQILADIPLTKLVKERIRPKRKLAAWEIVLLVLGFPVWFPLLAAAFAVLLSVYVVIWSLVIALWAVFAALVLAAAACLFGMVMLVIKNGAWLEAAGVFGITLVLAGLSVLTFLACVAATKGMAKLTKRLALWVKHLFVGKEK